MYDWSDVFAKDDIKTFGFKKMSSYTSFNIEFFECKSFLNIVCALHYICVLALNALLCISKLVIKLT